MKPRSSKGRLASNSGQFVIEGVLLMIVTISLIIYATKYARDNNWMANLIAGPWKKVAGMMETGVWEDPSTSRGKHPNQIDRHRTPYPKM